MVQFNILSGKMAGTAWSASRFPVRIGRSASADLQLEESGVWEDQAEVRQTRTQGFILESRPDALALINGEPAREVALRNGDTIQLGSVKMRFWLAPTRQRGLRVREWLVWTGLAAVCLGQVALIYWLVQ